MSVKTVRPWLNNAGGLVAGSTDVADTDPTPSPAIWQDLNPNVIPDGEWPGVQSFFDFDTQPKTVATTEGSYGLFTQFAGTTGAITADPIPVAGSPGASAWSFTSTASGDGVAIRTHVAPFQLNRGLGKFYFEARVKASAITDALSEVFLGLLEDVPLTSTLPFTSATVLSSNNLIGFFKAGSGTGSGAVMSTAYRANGVGSGQITVGSGVVPLTAATYVKLGMKYVPSVDQFAQDPNFQGLAKYNVYFYVNGVRLANSVQIPVALSTASGTFPNAAGMGFCFAYLAKNSTPDVWSIDWYKAAQVFSPGYVL